MLVAITEGRAQDLEDILADYEGDLTKKIYNIDDDGTEIMLSPFEMTIASHNIEMMSSMIEKKRPNIDIDTFDIVFRSNCVKCFDVLFDYSGLARNFNSTLFSKILKLSEDDDHYFAFVSKFAKKLGLNDQLALIENAFYSCTDHEKIMFALHAVLLDISYKDLIGEYLDKSQRAAVLAFTRVMAFKKDFVDMLPWIDSLYNEYPETERSKRLIENYKNFVKIRDNRDEDYSQPEEIIMRDDFEILLRIAESIKNKIKIDGI